MTFRKFHNPNISLPVIRRRVANEILELFFIYMQMMATRFRSMTWNTSFPNRSAYHAAIYRLRRSGLIAYQRSGENETVLMLTPKGEAQMPEVYKPETFWKRKWNGIWYVLVYDVPEKNRKYRNILRGFLSRMRMGCLQRSVWITPRDIRPEYHDLAQAASIQEYAFLFEAQTVLGQNSQELVEAAWNFDRLEEIQLWYCKVYKDNLKRLLSGNVTREELQNLAREEMSAYLSAMKEDPLLPRELLPAGYHGVAVYDLHKSLGQEIRERL